MSSYQTWDDFEADYPSSGDEQRNDRIRRSRDRLTDRNIERVHRTITSPELQNRACTAALNTIREDPLVRAQLQRIEEIWTVNKDKTLADVVYTEVTIAILQAANAIAGAGKNIYEEDGEHFEAIRSARARTVGNFQWSEPNSASSSTQSTPAEETELDFSLLKICADGKLS